MATDKIVDNFGLFDKMVKVFISCIEESNVGAVKKFEEVGFVKLVIETKTIMDFGTLANIGYSNTKWMKECVIDKLLVPYHKSGTQGVTGLIMTDIFFHCASEGRSEDIKIVCESFKPTKDDLIKAVNLCVERYYDKKRNNYGIEMEPDRKRTLEYLLQYTNIENDKKIQELQQKNEALEKKLSEISAELKQN